MSSRLFSIYENGVHPLILKAVADIGKPIQHLKSSFTAPSHTDDDQTARTHYVVKVQTFVVVRPQVYVRVDHVHSSANVWRCFVMQQRRIPTNGRTRFQMTIILQCKHKSMIMQLSSSERLTEGLFLGSFVGTGSHPPLRRYPRHPLRIGDFNFESASFCDLE